MVFELFLENPYFSAGAGLIGLGTVGAMLRQGMLRYSHLVKRQFLVSLEVSSRDKSYQWLLHWITKKTQTKSHHLSVQTLYKIHENGSAMTQFQFVPCPGIHYVRWMGRYFKVERQREKSLAAAGSLGTDFSNPAAPFETLTMTTIGRNPQVFTEILEEASEIALMKQQGKTVIYTSWANEWRPFGQPHQKRPLESVILANSISDAILKDVQEFNRNEDWYHTRGIPYRRGYLLHGPPGTGKSSFIKALAGALDYNICIISLNESNMTDDRLNYLLSVLPERSFLLLEDIDALFTETRQTASTYQSRITFSGLLNALDGVGSSEERLVFMTTNHFAKIDAALMRPGRVDVIHFVGMASQEQIYRMFCQFYPKKEFRDVDSEESHAVDAKYENMAREFCGHIPAGSLSPASIQGHFIMFKNNPQAAIDNIHLLLKLI